MGRRPHTATGTIRLARGGRPPRSRSCPVWGSFTSTDPDRLLARELTAATKPPSEFREPREEFMDRGIQKNDQHCREDQEDQREEHLQRRLLHTLLGRLAAACAHLDRKIAHHRADRDAERLALYDGPDEGPHGRCVGALEYVAQRLVGRQPHPLLLLREFQLVPERSLES